MLQGVIFDVDGTLVDSNEAHAGSWVDTLREVGIKVPFDVIWPMIGMGGKRIHLMDLRVHLDLMSQNFHSLRAFQKPPSKRSFSLKSGE